MCLYTTYLFIPILQIYTIILESTRLTANNMNEFRLKNLNAGTHTLHHTHMICAQHSLLRYDYYAA